MYSSNNSRIVNLNAIKLLKPIPDVSIWSIASNKEQLLFIWAVLSLSRSASPILRFGSLTILLNAKSSSWLIINLK